MHSLDDAPNRGSNARAFFFPEEEEERKERKKKERKMAILRREISKRAYFVAAWHDKRSAREQYATRTRRGAT